MVPQTWVFIMRYKTFYVEIALTEIDFLLVMDKYIFCIVVKKWNTIRKYDLKKDEYFVYLVKSTQV